MPMHRGERRLRIRTALCCVGLTLLVTLLDLPNADALRPMEHWLYDRRCRYCQFFTLPPTEKLVHLDIDDNALEDIGAWPWPRDLMASVMQEIGDAGPKAVAMDILYTEPRRVRLEPVHAAERPTTSPATTQATEQPAAHVAQVASTTNPAASLPPNTAPSTKPSTRPARIVPGIEVNEDAVLADTIRRLNNVILAVSLKLNTDSSHFYPDVRNLLINDLEMTDAEIAVTLASKGMKDANLDSRVREIFADARKDAAGIRVARELKSAEAEAARLRVPVLQVLYGRLLHKNTPLSPQGHAIDAGYVATLARRAARRFTLDLPGNLPPPAPGERELVPIPALSDAAAAEGFVEYPVYKDGHVRSVPLLMLFDGRVMPQIGLSLALRMMDASPMDLRISPEAVTIGRSGKGAPDVIIPVRTLRPEGGGTSIPYTFDIPWFGTSDWQQMYPRNPHLSIDKVYEVIHSREKIAENNEVVDTALEFLLELWDKGIGGHRRADFQSGRPRPDDWNGRVGLIKMVLDQYPDIPEDAKEEDAGDDIETRLKVRTVQTLRRALREQSALQRQVDKQRSDLKSIMHDKAVLIGWAATAAIADRKPTSIHPEAPGVVVHGTIFNGIMQGEMWRTLPAWVTAATTLTLGLLLTVIVTLLPPGRALAASFALGALFLVVNGILLFDRYNRVLGLAGPITVMLLVWAGGTVIRLVLERYERARITARFSSYVDPELVEFVLENENQDVFKGVEREMTVVFNDLAGFTALSDRLGKQIIPVLNEFMDLATRVIKQHHGYVNKFLGDGVMFFFNAPRPRVDYAGEAVQAVLDLQVMLEQFNVRLAQRGLPPLALRTGVTTGVMVVGDAGSPDRADYTVIGDLVNLASRLESANKAVGTSNLVTDRTVELAGDRFLFRPVGQIQVVGLPTAVMVFEAIAPMATATPEQKRMVALSAVMVDASLDGRPSDCLETIVRLEEEFGDCRLTQLYREKCEAYLGGQTAGDFDRQIVLTQK